MYFQHVNVEYKTCFCIGKSVLLNVLVLEGCANLQKHFHLIKDGNVPHSYLLIVVGRTAHLITANTINKINTMLHTNSGV